MEKKKRLIVTGGSGFIGTHFIQDFQHTYDEIVNVDINPPLCKAHEEIWKKIDLLDADSLDAFFCVFRPTHVVHLAARTDLDEKTDLNGYAANIQGVRNLLHAIRCSGSVLRLIIASSMLVCKVGHVPMSDDEYSPENLYAQSKVQTELITRQTNPHCVWTIVRPTTIWGPFHERLKNGFFKILQKKMYFHPGNKKCCKSYGYVGNTVFQIQKILDDTKENVHGETLYLADAPIQLDEWVNSFSQMLLGRRAKKVPYFCMKSLALLGDVIGNFSSKPFPMSSFRLRNMTTDNVIDTHKIENICFKAPYSLVDGVRKTCMWLNDDK